MWLAKLFGQIVKMVSPEVKASLLTWAQEQQVKAKATSNPWDDVLFDFLVMMLK
jgi:hypothetical protein